MLRGRNIGTKKWWDVLYPKWGYYRSTVWEHDTTLYIDQVCQFNRALRRNCDSL